MIFEIDLPSAHLRGAIFNGAKLLPAILASHLPLDLVIIMLGTNDLKTRFKRSAAKNRDRGPRTCPADRRVRRRSCDSLSDTESSAGRSAAAWAPGFHDPEEWAGSHEKSLELGSAFRDAAAVANLPFLDAGEVITTDGIDGIHFSAEAQVKARRSRRQEGLASFSKSRSLIS